MVTPVANPAPEGMIPSLSTATAWINSTPISGEQLRGKVVLIDFWTYTCINWRRTVPHLRAWVQRYGNSGLVLIGVHSPEFVFESHLIMRGRSIVEVKEVLGHGSLAMVMRYAHLAPSVTRATVHVLDEPAPSRAGV